MATKAERIVAGLGGIDNIEVIKSNIIRIHVEVVRLDLVDEAALMMAGAYSVVQLGTVIQVLVGSDANPIAAAIEDMRQRGSSTAGQVSNVQPK